MLISFCIPTYNRKDYLKATVLSIANEIITTNNTRRVQICISDNNSSDGTEEMVRELKTETQVQIVYSKNQVNIGFDKNILKATNLSNAEYIWLFGSDDLIVQGSLVKMIEFIDNYKSDIYICNRVECDLNVKPIKYDISNISLKTSFDTSIDSELIEYFNSCTGLLGVFSFISSLVCKNEIWSKQNFNEKYNGLVYAHVFMILGMIVNSKSNITLINDYYVLCRQNDDIIKNEGVVKRILLDINAYSEFANCFFSNNETLYKSFVSAVRKEHELSKFIFIKKNVQKEQWKYEVFPKLKELNYNPFFLFLINHSRLGSLFVRISYFIKQKIQFRFE
jgi:abequosyltransferase